MEDRQHYTLSKIGCWLALSNAAELARNGHIAGNAERWEKESERIRGWIDEHCWSEAKQCYKFHAGTERLRKRKAPLSHAPAGSSKPMRFSERSIGRGRCCKTCWQSSATISASSTNKSTLTRALDLAIFPKGSAISHCCTHLFDTGKQVIEFDRSGAH
ncbi:hypothetical protein [Rhizobium lentis]|uniref:Uncharacterized protein n=1 Tax=Rhizobium lentis TaxID=1138194 RepID=A0ABS7IMG5_9HYPH|nr:hypothetical protein [Rhizobium lentis]MBX4977161.1 hypothetical protein [Rhizobium lentis]MBX5093067.1 hypothetical protein [Rhizobium lentis]